MIDGDVGDPTDAAHPRQTDLVPPEDASWTTMRVCVVGAGYMGAGIAQVLAVAGARVRVVDRDASRAEDAVSRLIADAATFESAGLFRDGAAADVARLTEPASDIPHGVDGADLVVEAVFEDVRVKAEVLPAIEEAVPRDAVIATNTSAIPISTLSAHLADPSRLVGVHWFNPPQFVPGIEVIPTASTREGLVERMCALLTAAGKWPVVVRDTPGFVANRLQFAMFREAALMLEEAVAPAAAIDQVVRGTFGFRLPFYGPFAIADMAGLDVYRGAYTTLQDAYGDRFEPPRALSELVGSGKLGVKQGGGFLELDPAEIADMVRLRDLSYVALRGLMDDNTASAPATADDRRPQSGLRPGTASS